MQWIEMSGFPAIELINLEQKDWVKGKVPERAHLYE